MSIVKLILILGVCAGVLAILAVVLFDMLRKRLGDTNSGPMVPKTFVAGIGIGNIIGPVAAIARSGQNKPTRMSLNAAIMTPTPGLRLISLGGSALVLIMIWNPAMRAYSEGDLSLHMIATAFIAYAALFIAGYEARYDDEGITAPNWLFQDKHYPWEEFIFIRDDGHYLYRLRFERGRLDLQKYLVGMPTFLTFVSELGRMKNRD